MYIRARTVQIEQNQSSHFFGFSNRLHISAAPSPTSTLTHTSASPYTVGDGDTRPWSSDPTLDLDRQMSAYKMERDLEKISRLIKKEASAVRSACEKVIIDEACRTEDKLRAR